MALDENIVQAVSNSNFKAGAEIPGLLSNVLANNIVQLSTANIANAVQTASDSRTAGSAAMNTLIKRIAELDSIESGATAPILGHTQHYAAASGAGIDTAQLAQSIAQLSMSNQNTQHQLAQLNSLVAAMASKLGGS